LSGKEHRLHTAVVLLAASEGVMEAEVVASVLRMRALSEAEIARYVELEQPLDSAGSYRSEGLGAALFEWMRGDDPTAIVGLPLLTVVTMLSRHGLSPLSGAADRGVAGTPEG
jgi:septum formation protein